MSEDPKEDRREEPPPFGLPPDWQDRARRLLPSILVASAILVYALLVSLWLAVALVGMIVWHEWGHVRAAELCGVRSRGIFVIPFVGGVAALDSLGRSREDQLTIALGGPLFGLCLCLPALLAAFVLEGVVGASLRMALVMWAGLNLLNLLPVHPLDGGRVVHGLAHTISPFAGLTVSGFGVAALAALALATGHPVIFIVGIIGGLEFINEYRLYDRLKGAPSEGRREDAPDPVLRPRAEDERAPGALSPAKDPEEAYRRLVSAGRLPPRRVALFLAIYLALMSVYGGLLAVALFSPRLAAPLTLGGN